ncbi:MAG: thymidine kinase [Flavobacteriales bacterium]|nr:thymidine kinase [Flavobacteriales bacterium]
MFLEQKGNKKNRKGWIEVVCGSMFSGKTEELIRRLRRAQYANQQVQIFKPTVDSRYHQENVVSHNKNAIQSKAVSSSNDILELSNNIEVIGVDEAQFFDEHLPEVCMKLANNGIRVIVAGLDMDFKGKPFGPIPNLMAVAEFVSKVHAICLGCGDLAQFSHRKTKEDGLVLLGETQEYEPLCRKCFQNAVKNDAKQL